MPREARIVIGAIAGPHGVRGEALITSYLVGNLDISGIRDVLLIPAGAPPEPRRVTLVRGSRKGWILKIEGIDSPEEVSRVRGAKVEVDAVMLPPTTEGEFYWRDLIGLEVETISGIPLGTVKSILPGGAQDLLVVQADKREILIPAVEPIVVRIDLTSGRIVVDPPEGLIELSK